MTPQSRAEIARILEEHGLAPIHRLGQHFLADANITRKIVSVSGVGPGDQVVEVGAGTGTLTRALAGTGAHVVAYEVDQGLKPVLEGTTRGLDVELRFKDVTKVDFAEVFGTGRWSMVANLPYNVGTPLVLDAVRRAQAIERFVVMMQGEVAERFVASSGSADYGLPSVVAGIYTDASIAFRVPPQVFYPPPRVESAVVLLIRKAAPAHSERAVKIARAGFGQRRKMLRRSLKSMFDDPSAVLEDAGIDPTSRAEDLAPEDFLRLAQVVA